MRMAVCDDEKSFRDEIRKVVYSYSDLHRLEIVLNEFECGEDLLDSKDEHEMIFLDYKMEGISGLETARKLRERNVNSTIIFLTSFPEFVYESFEVDTFRFFKKPLDESKLNKALDDYFEANRKSRPILIQSGREKICIQSNDVVYLEADNKKCYISLVDKRLHLPKTLASIEKLLPYNDFIKVHKAFIVNLNYISHYDNERIFFKNGECANISRNYLTAFKNAYRIYAKNRIL